MEIIGNSSLTHPEPWIENGGSVCVGCHAYAPTKSVLKYELGAATCLRCA